MNLKQREGRLIAETAKRKDDRKITGFTVLCTDARENLLCKIESLSTQVPKRV